MAPKIRKRVTPICKGGQSLIIKIKQAFSFWYRLENISNQSHMQNYIQFQNCMNFEIRLYGWAQDSRLQYYQGTHMGYGIRCLRFK